MYKLLSTILKDARLLARDKVGLILMFLMPILLVVVITSLQNATFDLVNNNKVPMVLCNKDTGSVSTQLNDAIHKIGMFEITEVTKNLDENQLSVIMKEKGALVTVVIPSNFSAEVKKRASDIASKSLNEFGIAKNTTTSQSNIESLILYYNPVLQESFRQSILGGLLSAQKLVESKQIVRTLYYTINSKVLPASLENQIINNQPQINQVPVLHDGSRTIPNVTQHNIPAWTIFAMFFIVVSLGSNVVKEKISGSSVRLRTLPTNYIIVLLSKMITYLIVCLAQVLVIFSIGIWLFPIMGLPKLNLPNDLFGLLIVSLLSGWCAVSFAICLGIYSKTQEQVNGIGAVSIVILAAIGGIMVPSFAMPASFHLLLKISPLHWCLQSFYGLFLEGGNLRDIVTSILPLLLIIIIINTATYIGLKRENLI